MILEKSFVWRGHRWNEIRKNDNKNMVEAGFDVIIARQPSYSELKRYGHSVGAIDANSKKLISKYPRLANAIKTI